MVSCAYPEPHHRLTKVGLEPLRVWVLEREGTTSKAGTLPVEPTSKISGTVDLSKISNLEVLTASFDRRAKSLHVPRIPSW